MGNREQIVSEISLREIRERIDRLPRVRLAHLPTPLEEMPRLSAHLGGPRILIKRDDCTGLAFGGNKTRHNEFVLGRALEEGADTLVWGAGVQSNNCRQTAAAAAKLGLECYLVLSTQDSDDEFQGNLLLDHLVGAHVELTSDPMGPALWHRLEEKTEALRRQGRKVFTVADPRARAAAAVSYTLAVLELLEQLKDRDLTVDAVYFSSAGSLSLFDERDLAEIQSPDYPGERLIVCRNPLLAEEWARNRQQLLQATEVQLEKIVQATRRPKRRFKGKDRIALRGGKVLNRYKVGKHFVLDIGEESFSYQRQQERIEQEAALDGIYVIRTNLACQQMAAEPTVAAYKGLSVAERAFRSCKSVDLKVRPIYHHLENRVRAHVFLCMLAYYVEWHMRQKLAPILFDDEDPEAGKQLRDSVVAPSQRSAAALRKVHRKRTDEGEPVHSFQTLLSDLATISKNRIQPQLAGSAAFDKVTRPTSLQQRALDLLGVRL